MFICSFLLFVSFRIPPVTQESPPIKPFTYHACTTSSSKQERQDITVIMYYYFLKQNRSVWWLLILITLLLFFSNITQLHSANSGYNEPAFKEVNCSVVSYSVVYNMLICCGRKPCQGLDSISSSPA